MKYFPTSDAVNKALRSLIEIIPTKKRIVCNGNDGEGWVQGERA
jgi:hypothetical protein